MSAAIGIDVGGTKVEGLAVDEAGRVLARRREPTPASDADATTDLIAEVARGLLAEDPDAPGIGVGAAGLVDRRGAVRFSPNLAWRDFPLAERLQEGLGIPVLVDNDATVAAWGEFRFGAGRGAENMLLVTVGTGIGGGIVAGGEVFHGANGLSGEIGHVIVEPGGPRCGCGNLGCWEQMAAGRAIDRLGREAARRNPESALGRMGHPDEISGVDVMEAARAGDHVAVEVFEEVGRRLGEGIAGLANVLDPDVVVVGGGVIGAGELLLAPARRAFAAAVLAPDHRPEIPIVAAALGNDAGAVGAADLARRAAGRVD